MDRHGKTKEYNDGGFPPSLPVNILATLDLVKNAAMLDSICQPLSMVKTSRGPDDPYDSQSLASFLKSNCWFTVVRDIVSVICRVSLGLEPSQVSALFFLRYCKGAGGLMPLCEAKKGCGQESRIHGGSQQLSLRLAAALPEGSVLLNTPVLSVLQEGLLVKVTTSTGRTFVGHSAVCAVPPHLAAAIEHTPPLNDVKRFLYTHMPMGHLVKVLLLYDEPFWRKAGLSGEAICCCPPCCFVLFPSTPHSHTFLPLY